jgi:hypothetical protein
LPYSSASEKHTKSDSAARSKLETVALARVRKHLGGASQGRRRQARLRTGLRIVVAGAWFKVIGDGAGVDPQIAYVSLAPVWRSLS